MWEVATGRDITRFEPLALTRLAEAGAAGVSAGAGRAGGRAGVRSDPCSQRRAGASNRCTARQPAPCELRRASHALAPCRAALAPRPGAARAAARLAWRCPQRRRRWRATSLPPAPSWSPGCAPTPSSWWSGERWAAAAEWRAGGVAGECAGWAAGPTCDAGCTGAQRSRCPSCWPTSGLAPLPAGCAGGRSATAAPCEGPPAGRHSPAATLRSCGAAWARAGRLGINLIALDCSPDRKSVV